MLNRFKTTKREGYYFDPVLQSELYWLCYVYQESYYDLIYEQRYGR